MSSPIIWGGNASARMLNQGPLQFFNGTEIHEYDGSPAGALEAAKGTIVIDRTNGKIYINTDGSTTYRDVEALPAHNSLSGLNDGDYNHLTDAEYTGWGAHVASTANPHNVTKTQVGLGNVPDTDATNPANISQTASYRFVTDTEKSVWNGKMVNYSTVAEAEAATPTEPAVCYIDEKHAIYSYCATCSFTADGDLVLNTGNGGTTRWEMVQKMSRTQGDTGWISTSALTLTALSATQIRLNVSAATPVAIKAMRYALAAGNYDFTISGAAGVKYLYFDDATLTIKQRESVWDFNTQVPIAVVYWNGSAIVAAPQTEYHGIRDTVWHIWAHRFLGLQYVSGLSFTGSVQADNVNNPGADDTVFYLWSTTGIVQDEDAQSTPGTGQWLQTLGSGLASGTAAAFNFFYFNGSVVTTQAAMANRAPFIHAGNGTTPQWNNGGSLTASVTGDYIVYHYFVTPMVGGWSVFARPHNAKYTSLATALGAVPGQLTWTNYEEIKHIYTAVFRVNTTWSNTHRCKLVSLRDFRTTSGTPASAVNPSAHNSLSGLELAGAGVTWGHINNIAQSIDGAKTFTTHPISTENTTPDGNDLIPVSRLGPVIAAATGKTTLVDADMIPIADSASSNALADVTFANVKASLKPYNDALYANSNYIINPNGELSRTAEITVGAGVAAPTDSPSVIRGTASFRLTGAVTAGATTWWQWNLKAIESFFVGKPLSFSLKTSASAANAFKVAIVNVTDATELAETVVNIPAGAYEARGFFLPVTGKTYGLRITQLTNGTYTVDVDEVYVGDTPVQYGQAVTDWVEFIPSITSATGFALTKGFYRRVGDSAQIAMRIQKDANAGSGTFYISPPAGLTVDVTRLPITPASHSTVTCGFAALLIGGTTYQSAYHAVWFASTTNAIAIENLGSSNLVTGTTLTANTTVSIQVTLPIVGWSSNTQTGARAVEEYASNSSQADSDDTTSFVYGPNGSPLQGATLNANRLRRCRFQSPIQPTDALIFEYWDSARWVSLTGYGIVQGVDYFASFDYAGSFGVGQIRGVAGSTTDIDVTFGRYARGTTNWPAGFATTGRWRVRKVSGGGMVGYPISGTNIIARSDGSVPGSGYSGEHLTANGNSAQTVTDTLTNALSISLTPGTWEVWATGTPSPNGSYVESNYASTFITVGASVGSTIGVDWAIFNTLVANRISNTLFVKKVINLATTTTVKVQSKARFSAGAVTWYESISAVRLP